MKLISVLWTGGSTATFYNDARPQNGWIENHTFVAKLLCPTGFEVICVEVTDSAEVGLPTEPGVITQKRTAVDGSGIWGRIAYSYTHPEFTRRYADSRIYKREGARQPGQPNTAVPLDWALEYYSGLCKNVYIDVNTPAGKLFSAVYAELQKHVGE